MSDLSGATKENKAAFVFFFSSSSNFSLAWMLSHSKR